MSPWTESHSELKDGARLSFARVEFSPKDLAEAHKLETYSLKIDEERTPEWFDAEMKEAVVAPGAKVSTAHSMVINVISGGTVNDIMGGTVNAIWGDYSPIIKSISKSATIVRDNRKQP